MATLTAKINGVEFAKLELEDGREYLIGRSSDCDLILSEAAGISRTHFKLVQHDGIWQAHGLSRFIPLTHEGMNLDIVELADSTIFFADPYEFHFETENAPMINITPAVSPEPVTITDATELGTVIRKPCLKIGYVDRNETELLQLEGNHWVAGRDSDSEIPIRDNRASRSHFEIFRTRENFFLVDLGSANGTTLNGTRAPEHDPIRLESGDVVAISGVEMTFEIRDTSSGVWPDMPRGVARDQALFPRSASEKKSKLRHSFYAEAQMLAIVLVVTIGSFGFHVWNLSRGNVLVDRALASDNLKPGEKIFVKESFAQAQSLYAAGKYDACLVELNKVHLMIPNYEYSEDLQDFCEQGIELTKHRNEVDRINRATEKMTQEVASVVARCKKQLTEDSSVAETRSCLEPALIANPADPAIGELISAAKARVAEQKIVKERDHERKTREYICKSGVKHAKSLSESNKLAQAILAYDSVMGSSCADANIAKREVASIRVKLDAKISGFLKQCEDFGHKGQFKDAYKYCDRAVTEDPSNEAAKTRAAQMALELRHQIKNIYDDSVLEESLGNVDSAVEKWRRIVREDLDFDDYARKAKAQLEKYGMSADGKRTARLTSPDGI